MLNAFSSAIPSDLMLDRVELRQNLVDEEHEELNIQLEKAKAFLKANRHVTIEVRREILDAIVDSIYVLIGMAITFGFDLEGAFKEVHASNMSKLGDGDKPIYRSDGKVMKGPHYKPPYLDPYI